MSHIFTDLEIDYEIKIYIQDTGDYFKGESILDDSTIESISEDIVKHFNKVLPLSYSACNIIDDEEIEHKESEANND